MFRTLVSSDVQSRSCQCSHPRSGRGLSRVRASGPHVFRGPERVSTEPSTDPFHVVEGLLGAWCLLQDSFPRSASWSSSDTSHGFSSSDGSHGVLRGRGGGDRDLDFDLVANLRALAFAVPTSSETGALSSSDVEKTLQAPPSPWASGFLEQLSAAPSHAPPRDEASANAVPLSTCATSAGPPVGPPITGAQSLARARGATGASSKPKRVSVSKAKAQRSSKPSPLRGQSSELPRAQAQLRKALPPSKPGHHLRHR